MTIKVAAVSWLWTKRVTFEGCSWPTCNGLRAKHLKLEIRLDFTDPFLKKSAPCSGWDIYVTCALRGVSLYKMYTNYVTLNSTQNISNCTKIFKKKNLTNCIENDLVTVLPRENKMLFNKIKADLLRIWIRIQIWVPCGALQVRKKPNFKTRPQNHSHPYFLPWNYFHQNISTISGKSKQIHIYGGNNSTSRGKYVKIHR